MRVIIMYILTVDIGNSNVVFGLFLNKKPTTQWRIKTNLFKNPEAGEREFVKSLQNNLLLKSIKIEGVVLASVVPDITEFVSDIIRRETSVQKIVTIGDPKIKLGVDIDIANPNEVGADILINMVAIKEKYKLNVIVVDMGTATTFDNLDNKGVYVGSVIAPGIKQCARVLTSSCAQLPDFDVTKQENVIGKDTVEAMKSGVYFGYIGLVKEVVIRLKTEKSGNAKVVLTGGAANIIKDELLEQGVIDEYIKDLTLEGLMLIWYMNN